MPHLRALLSLCLRCISREQRKQYIQTCPDSLCFSHMSIKAILPILLNLYKEIGCSGTKHEEESNGLVIKLIREQMDCVRADPLFFLFSGR